MPNNGLIVNWEAVEYRVGSSVVISESGDGNPTYSHTAQAETRYAPSAIVTVAGIELSVTSSWDGAVGSWTVTYDGPGGPFSSGGATFKSSVSISAVINNLKIYSKLTGSLIRVVWDSVDIYIDDVYDSTLAGSSVDAVSNGVGQNYISYIGIPLDISGGRTAARTGVPTFTYDSCNPSVGAPIAYNTSVTQTISGGRRFKESGVWYSLPVKIVPYSLPDSTGCPYGLNLGGIYAGTNSWDVTLTGTSAVDYLFKYLGRYTKQVNVIVTCVDVGGGSAEYTYGPYDSECVDPCDSVLKPGYVDVYTTETTTDESGGRVMVLPNLTKEIIKIGDTFRELWYRGKFPQTKYRATRSCDNGVTSFTQNNDVEVHPELSVFLGSVNSDPHPIEEPFDYDSYAPVLLSKSKNYTLVHTTYQPVTCVCPPSSFVYPSPDPCPAGHGIGCEDILPGFTDLNYSESVSLTFPYFVGAGGEYQTHTEDEPRYIASWSTPHWLFGLWFQDWEVDGFPMPHKLYWQWLPEQHQFNTGLPANEKRKTRNSIMSSLCEQSGHVPFLDFIGWLPWIGVHRFKTQAVNISPTFTLTQTRHCNWYSSECNITFNAGDIQFDTFTGATAEVYMDLLSWTVDPYLLLAFSKALNLTWSVTNVDSITIELEGIDGSITTLGTAQGDYNYPQGEQSKYAGTWAIDNGVGVVSDNGSDFDGDGISSATMSDPLRATYFELAQGRTFRRLKLTIDPTDTGLPVNINYPKFYYDDNGPTYVWESSKCLSMLITNGPKVRWGNLLWYHPFLGFNDPPLISGMGIANTIIDWLAYRRRVLQGNGTANLANDITTELATLYDTYEGQAISVVDKFSQSVIMPRSGKKIIGILINSFSELPPLSEFPFRSRDVDWQPTGDHAQIVYEMSEEIRPLVSSDKHKALLTDDNDNPVGQSRISPPLGWNIWDYQPALDNDETGWKVKDISGNQFATLRPFHGHSCILAKTTPDTGEQPSLTHDSKGFGVDTGYCYAYIKSSDVYIKYSSYVSNSLGWEHETQITSSGNCSSVSVAVDNDGILKIVYVKGSDVVYRTSTDQGRTWTSEVVVLTNNITPKIESGDGKDLAIMGFKYDSGSSGPGKLYVISMGAEHTAVPASVIVQDHLGVDISVEDSGFDITYGFDGFDSWLLVCKLNGETENKHFVSHDRCLTFRELPS